MSLGAVLGAVDFVNDDTWRLLTTGGSSWAGTAQPRTSTLPSAVLDGSIVIHESDDNRTLSFDVAWGTKPSVEGRAAAAARVEYELGKRNTFTYSPMNGEPSSVYRVMDSSWEYVSSDTDEKSSFGMWRVTLTCLPYVFSEDEVTDVALVGNGTGATTIDAGTSATGWTSINGTVTSTGSVLTIPLNPSQVGGYQVQAKKTFTSTSFASTPFVSWDVALAAPEMNTFGGFCFTQNAASATASGTYIGATPAATAGFTTVWFYFASPQTNATSITFDFSVRNSSGGASSTQADNLVRTGTLPFLPGGSGVTTMRHIEVSGTRRTPGRLTVDLGSGGGSWLTYTGPNLGYGGAYNPLITATSFTIATGAVTPGISTKSFTVPVAGLPPGGYLLVGNLSGAVNGTQTKASPITLNWTATQSNAPANSAQRGSKVFDTTLNTGVASTGQQMATIAPLVLPLGDVEAGSSSTLTFTFTPDDGSSQASNFTVLALFLFYMGPGAALNMQTTAPNRYLFIDSPDVDRPRPRVMIGSLADGSNAVSQIGNVSSAMTHVWTPPVTMLFTYGSIAIPTAGLTHTPAWGDFAGL